MSWQRMAMLARRYYRFPLIASWTALLDAAGGNQLLYILIASQYSATIAGFIFLIERVIARPLSMVGTSILQVFVGEAGQTATMAPDKLKSRFRQVVKHQFCLAAGWIVVANIGAAMFFPTVFGREWSEAVVYLQAMSLGYLVQATVQPVFHTLQLLEKQGTAAAWQITRVTATVGIFVFGASMHMPPDRVVLCYSIAQALCCGVLILLMNRAINQLQRKAS
jgi:O-antigen/teichoic acid export membrane protein